MDLKTRFIALLGLALVILALAEANGEQLEVGTVAGTDSALEVYRLKIRLTTTSDWTKVAFQETTMAAFVTQVLEGSGAADLRINSTLDLAVYKRQFDETKVIVDFEVYLMGIHKPQLMIAISKGHLNYTSLELFNYNRDQPQFIVKLTHQGVIDPNDPENKRVFTVSSSQFTAGGPLSLPRRSFGKKVLAFYYPWYGTPSGPTGQWRHWDPNKPRYTSTHTPLAGYYDSLDEMTITRHIREAREAGIDAFIVSWWGITSFEDRAFRKILPIAEREQFLVTIYYEVARNRTQIVQDLIYILRNYSSSAAFLKLENIPVIFIYDRVTQQFNGRDWAFVFQQLEQQGLRCFCIGDGLGAAFWVGDDKFDFLFEHFQGVHTYTPVAFPLDLMRRFYAANAVRARVKNKLFAATVVPGHDDRWVRSPPLVRDRENGAYYRQTWEAAVASDPDWILVTSFNEWHEGTEIEPSVEFGRQYLALTRQLVDSWKRR